jgi:hypothetical protein
MDRIPLQIPLGTGASCRCCGVGHRQTLSDIQSGFTCMQQGGWRSEVGGDKEVVCVSSNGWRSTAQCQTMWQLHRCGACVFLHQHTHMRDAETCCARVAPYVSC